MRAQGKRSSTANGRWRWRARLDLKQQLAFTLKDLAPAYIVCGRLADAGSVLPEALSLWRELDNKPMLAEVLMGQTVQYCGSGELDQAILRVRNPLRSIRASATVTGYQSPRASSR